MAGYVVVCAMGVLAAFIAKGGAPQVDRAPWFASLSQTLPQQAMMCDVAGIGYLNDNLAHRRILMLSPIG